MLAFMSNLLRIGVVVLILILLLSLHKATAESPNKKIVGESVEIVDATEYMTVREGVDFYADKWGVSRKVMHFVVKCESDYNPKAYNGNDKHKNSVGSHGAGQYAKETFDTFSKEMGLENGDPYNPNHALDVMGYMLSKGLGRHWSCFNRINAI